MRQQDETRLKNAIEALRAAEPDSAQIAASAGKLASRFGISMETIAMNEIMESCEDVKLEMRRYREGKLSSARSLLVEAHLRDCSACRHQFKSGAQAGVDWSVPHTSRVFVAQRRAYGWAMAACFALLVCGMFVYRAYWQVPPGVRAEVQSIDGAAYRVSDTDDRRLMPGDKLAEGEHLRTATGAHAVLRLADGSTVEMNERSVLGVGARGQDMTVSLDKGAVIVQAAHRNSGHLYVSTPDCRVAVTGTVFSVNSGIKGSRVAVLQGSVHVAHLGVDTLLQAGDQLATNDTMSPAPFEQQVSWSHDSDKYLPLLAQFATLRNRIGQIPFPQARYTSDLLARVPADTLLYLSIPNLGDFLSEANTIFHDQLNQSPALQQWWSAGKNHNTEQLDAMVNKVHGVSQFLGNEIVVVGVNQSNNQGVAIVADLQKEGLGDFLKTQFPAENSNGGLVVLDEVSLNAAASAGKTQSGGYALVRAHEVVFSNSISLLKEMNAQLNAGASGFAASDFGTQVSAAYSRGAGIILAANLHQMINDQINGKQSAQNEQKALQSSGLNDLQYLIAEHREANGAPENHLNLQFAGTRQRVASWLGAPAPIGSLDFVTPNAAVAIAGLSKDPKAIADDLIAIAAGNNGAAALNEAEAKLQINLRDDLAANLGGDYLIALDGPVLPTPSWKAVVEVNNAELLEQTLEKLAQSIDALTANATAQKGMRGAHQIGIDSSMVGSQRFYSLHDLTVGITVAQYTYADGYMILAPNRALLLEAIKTHDSGNSLARSAAFKALLPKDANENYSAVAYQNLSPVLTPLLSQFSGESADAIRQLAADSKPTAVCAWGKDNRIEAASDSRLFGFDFLTLGTLMNSRNKFAAGLVRQ